LEKSWWNRSTNLKGKKMEEQKDQLVTSKQTLWEIITSKLAKELCTSNKDIQISNEDGLQLKINNDITIVIDGELEIITNGKRICMDSLDSEIHFNSRIGRTLKDKPESIEYMNKLKTHHDNQIKTAVEYRERLEEYVCKLEERVIELEDKIKEIGNQKCV
jgi:hypothetical protein